LSSRPRGVAEQAVAQRQCVVVCCPDLGGTERGLAESRSGGAEGATSRKTTHPATRRSPPSPYRCFSRPCRAVFAPKEVELSIFAMVRVSDSIRGLGVSERTGHRMAPRAFWSPAALEVREAQDALVCLEAAHSPSFNASLDAQYLEGRHYCLPQIQVPGTASLASCCI
jgi:hypothetical protein